MEDVLKRDPMVFLQSMLANAVDAGDTETVLHTSRMIDELTVASAEQRSAAGRTDRQA